MFRFKAALTGAFMCIAAAIVSTGPAQATLLSIPDSQGEFPGADVVTFDVDANLEWLDLTESTNRSFSDVSSQFGAGGDFEGWRHATALEVTTLFGNAGFSPPISISSILPGLLPVIDQLGRTLGIGESIASPGFFIAAFGVFDDGNFPTTFGGTVMLLDGELGDPGTTVLVTPGIPPPAVPVTFRGHWLLRDPAPVPEPTALIMFGSGVVLLGAVRRRSRGN